MDVVIFNYTLVVKINYNMYYFPPYLCSVKLIIQKMNMEKINSKQEDIRRRAENLIHRNEQLIAILDNWMPSEQANANMEREIMERNRKSHNGAMDKSAFSTGSSRWKRLLKQLTIEKNNLRIYNQ